MRRLYYAVLVMGIAPAVFAQQSDLDRLRELFGGPATRYPGSPVASETYTVAPVPPSMRGKQWSELLTYAGVVGSRSTYYERVIIVERLFTSAVKDKRPGAHVIVKNEQCGWMAGQDPFDRPPEGK